MVDTFLNIRDDLPGICLIPATIEVLGDNPELNNEIAGQVLWLNLAALFPPKPQQGCLVIAHDDPSVRTADEIRLTVSGNFPSLCHMASSI